MQAWSLFLLADGIAHALPVTQSIGRRNTVAPFTDEQSEPARTSSVWVRSVGCRGPW